MLLLPPLAVASSNAAAQGSCGLFEPSVSFVDGTKACVNQFALFTRKGLIAGREFPDFVAVAKAFPRSHAIAMTADPERCPHVQFVAWNWVGVDAQEALPRCQQRMQEAVKNDSSLSACQCEVLIDRGQTKLNRTEFTQRLLAAEHFVQTGQTLEQARFAQTRRQEEEAKREVHRIAEEQRRRAEAEKVRKEEEERFKRLRQDEERHAAQAAAQSNVARPSEISMPLELADPSSFPSRVALVIGNAAYTGRWALKNPRNDAQAIAEQFKAMGFDVLLYLDVKVTQIGEILDRVSRRMRPGGAFVFYYAGHGLQLRGENYFPAVDASIRTQFDVPTQSVSLQHVLNLADDAKAELRFMFLDACRDNPWQVASRSFSGGLAKIEPPKGTLISYATRPGSVADDGEGANGVYTSQLLRHISTPNLPIESVFKRVASEVYRATNGRQEPWYEGNLRGEFAFVVRR